MQLRIVEAGDPDCIVGRGEVAQFGATSIRAISRFVVGSIRDTVPDLFDVQKEPWPQAAPSGPSATLIVATGRFVAGSMRVTVPADQSALHAEPPPNPTPIGPSPTRMWATTRFVSGSMRTTSSPAKFATQTAPAPIATPIGSATSIFAITVGGASLPPQPPSRTSSKVASAGLTAQ